MSVGQPARRAPRIRPAVAADIPAIVDIVERAYQISVPRIVRRPLSPGRE